MTKGRVVVVTPNEPYPFGQANGRWCHAMLKGLADAGWDVRCFSVAVNQSWVDGARDAFRDSPVQLRFYSPGKGGGALAWRRKWRTLRQPFSYTYSDALRRDLDRELAEGYDALHLEQLWAGYLDGGRPRTVTNVHHLVRLDLAGVWKVSSSFLMTKVLTNVAERRLLSALGRIRVTTDRLAREVTALNGRVPIDVVPIALDPALFPFAPGDRTEEPVIGFVGSINWTPGRLAAERLITRILPLVRAQYPEARARIVGWNARRLLARYVDTPHIEIVQDVPDAQPYFFGFRVFAYPLPQGSGMMAKVLEAMAYGIPIVTTTEGIEGFAAHDGVHVSLADDDAAFADHVVRLLRDGAARRAQAICARALIEEHYSPVPAARQLEQIYGTWARA